MDGVRSGLFVVTVSPLLLLPLLPILSRSAIKGWGWALFLCHCVLLFHLMSTSPPLIRFLLHTLPRRSHRRFPFPSP